MSSHPIKISAGSMLDLSLATFGSVRNIVHNICVKFVPQFKVKKDKYFINIWLLLQKSITSQFITASDTFL